MINLDIKKITKLLIIIAVLLVLWLCAAYYLVAVKGDSIYVPELSKNLSYKVPIKTDYVKNKAGENIEILTTQSQKPNSAEIFLYFHGNGGRSPRLIEEMAKFGTVISPAYPGFSGSEGKPSSEKIYETADLTMAWLVDQGITPSQIIVIGHSMGGSAALYTASEYPDLKKMILVGAFYSIQAMCETQFSILCVMASNILNNSYYAPQIRVKVRQFHNPNDQTVPFSQGKNIFDLIPSKDKKFIELRGGGPDFHNNFSVAEILVD